MDESKAPFNVHENDNNKKYSPYGIPNYLSKNYWWAYLSPLGIQFFDNGFIVNRILWGQYHDIAAQAVELIASSDTKAQRVAGISCAYGEFFPLLSGTENVEQLYLFDVVPGQLSKVNAKLTQGKTHLFLGNAEQIAMKKQVIDTSVLFFLLHEVPTKVRANVLFEAIRITKKSGRLIIADYAENNHRHFFHRVNIFRQVFEKLEPCLADFWHSNLLHELSAQAQKQERKITLIKQTFYFNRFYRLLEFSVN